MPANQGLRPFIAIPKDLREWTRWMRDQVLSSDDDTVSTETIQDKAVTYAKIQDVTADRILGRLSADGVVTEITAAQLVTLLEAEGWTFSGTVKFSGNIGFYGTTPVVQAAAYTPTNVNTDRSYDADSTTIDELADVLGTLIADLQTYGLLQ